MASCCLQNLADNESVLNVKWESLCLRLFFITNCLLMQFDTQTAILFLVSIIAVDSTLYRFVHIVI